MKAEFIEEKPVEVSIKPDIEAIRNDLASGDLKAAFSKMGEEVDEV